MISLVKNAYPQLLTKSLFFVVYCAVMRTENSLKSILLLFEYNYNLSKIGDIFVIRECGVIVRFVFRYIWNELRYS